MTTTDTFLFFFLRFFLSLRSRFALGSSEVVLDLFVTLSSLLAERALLVLGSKVLGPGLEDRVAEDMVVLNERQLQLTRHGLIQMGSIPTPLSVLLITLTNFMILYSSYAGSAANIQDRFTRALLERPWQASAK
jgi:hypothetical protein